MIADLLASLRPAQWTKNLLVFAGLIFSQGFLQPGLIGRVVLAFLVFCVLSGRSRPDATGRWRIAR